MKYSFLEEKYNNKYNKSKLFEYDQFDDEEDYEDDDEVENIDQKIINDMSCVFSNITELSKKIFNNNISIQQKEKYIKYNKILLNDKINNKAKNTVLIVACARNNIEIAKLLLNYGANPDIQNIYGNTPLIAASRRNNIEIVQLLLDNKADPNIYNIFDNNALLEAYMESNYEIIKLLLEHGADPNIQNTIEDIPTPKPILICACEYNDFKLVKLLLEHGADPNIQDDLHETALIKICKISSFKIEELFKIVKLLLEHGADPNIQDILYKETPLMSIVDSYWTRRTHGASHIEIAKLIELLLKYRANPYIKNKFHEDTLDIVSKPGNKKLFELFEEDFF